MRRFLLISTLLSVLLLFGCAGLFKREAIPIRYYRINYPEPTVASTYQSKKNLLVKRVKVNSAYDRGVLIFRDRDQSFGFYTYDEWLSNADEQIYTLVSRDLLKFGLFSSLVARDSGVLPDYILNIFLTELFEDRTEDDAKAVVSLTYTLSSRSDDKILYQKDFNVTRSSQEGNPDSFAKEVSLCLEQIEKEFLPALKQAIQSAEQEKAQ